MKKILSLLLIVLLSAPFAQAKIKLIQARIEPAEAAAGDMVKVTVEFSGKADKIKEVMIIPREFAYDIDEPYSLTKDASGKNVWTLEGPIPYEAPAGIVNLEIKAIDKKGKEIVIKDYKDQVHGKAGLITFEIK